MHGHVYANNNPSTLSDPTGLRPDGSIGETAKTTIGVTRNEASKAARAHGHTKSTGASWTSWDTNRGNGGLAKHFQNQFESSRKMGKTTHRTTGGCMHSSRPGLL